MSENQFLESGSAMEVFYFLVFGGLAAVVAALELSKTSKDRINTSTAFTSFKNNYLLVYSLMMGKLRSQVFSSFFIWGLVIHGGITLTLRSCCLFDTG